MSSTHCFFLSWAEDESSQAKAQASAQNRSCQTRIHRSAGESTGAPTARQSAGACALGCLSVFSRFSFSFGLGKRGAETRSSRVYGLGLLSCASPALRLKVPGRRGEKQVSEITCWPFSGLAWTKTVLGDGYNAGPLVFVLCGLSLSKEGFGSWGGGRDLMGLDFEDSRGVGI